MRNILFISLFFLTISYLFGQKIHHKEQICSQYFYSDNSSFWKSNRRPNTGFNLSLCFDTLNVFGDSIWNEIILISSHKDDKELKSGLYIHTDKAYEFSKWLEKIKNKNITEYCEKIEEYHLWDSIFIKGLKPDTFLAGVFYITKDTFDNTNVITYYDNVLLKATFWLNDRKRFVKIFGDYKNIPEHVEVDIRCCDDYKSNLSTLDDVIYYLSRKSSDKYFFKKQRKPTVREILGN